MTIGAPVTSAKILAELQLATPSRTYPLSLTDADVRALAGVASGPISMSNLLGKSGGAGLGATVTNGGGSFSSVASGGTATCSPSVSAFGGTPGYTYLWSFTSNPNTCSLTFATSAACTVSKAFSIGTSGVANATLQCIITDSASGTVTKTGITATLNWDNGS